MIKYIDISHLDTAKKVLDLQKVSYLIEAKYIGTINIPPLMEKLEELMDCKETFLGSFVDGYLAGVLSYKVDHELIDIHRLMVHPDYFRKGIGKELICYLEIMHLSAKEIIVSTGAKNTPAVNLYFNLGFEKIEEREVYGGVLVANFKKIIKRDSK